MSCVWAFAGGTGFWAPDSAQFDGGGKMQAMARKYEVAMKPAVEMVLLLHVALQTSGHAAHF